MTVMVLNGWSASAEAWSLCSFMRRPDVHLFSYLDQLPSSGHEPSATSHLPSLAEQFLVRQEKVLLVGWSLGGINALRLAGQFPGKVAGLVLIAATPRLMEDPATGWRGMSERRLEALKKGLQMTHGQGFFGVDPAKPNPYATGEDADLERGLAFLRETDCRAGVANIPKDIPVYLFQSEKDGIVRSSSVAFIREHLPQTVVRLVPGSEHALPILLPSEIDAAVESALCAVQR